MLEKIKTHLHITALQENNAQSEESAGDITNLHQTMWVKVVIVSTGVHREGYGSNHLLCETVCEPSLKMPSLKPELH